MHGSEYCLVNIFTWSDDIPLLSIVHKTIASSYDYINTYNNVHGIILRNIYFLVGRKKGVGGELGEIGNRLRYTNCQIEKQAWVVKYSIGNTVNNIVLTMYDIIWVPYLSR